MIRVGVIGTGNIACVHAKQLRKISNIELYAFNINQDHLKRFVEQFDATRCETENELLQKSDVIYVCTPTDTHYPIASRCLQAGKPVFLEKPIGLNIPEAVDLLEISNKLNVPIIPGHVVRFFPEYKKAYYQIKEGNLGKIASARLSRGGRQPIGSEKWFTDHNRSGGVLLDLAIHDFDWLRWTLGEVESVYSQSVSENTRKGDYALTILKFKAGAIAHVESSWLDPGGFRTSFEISGSAGFLEYSSLKNKNLTIEKQFEVFNEAHLSDFEDPYYLQTKNFLDHIYNGLSSVVSFEDGIKAMQLSFAAIDSAQKREPIKIGSF